MVCARKAAGVVFVYALVNLAVLCFTDAVVFSCSIAAVVFSCFIAAVVRLFVFDVETLFIVAIMLILGANVVFVVKMISVIIKFSTILVVTFILCFIIHTSSAIFVSVEVVKDFGIIEITLFFVAMTQLFVITPNNTTVVVIIFVVFLNVTTTTTVVVVVVVVVVFALLT